MKIFIICDKDFAYKIPTIKSELEKNSHIVLIPNYYNPNSIENIFKTKKQETDRKIEIKNENYNKILESDAVLVLNYTKFGLENYIGGDCYSSTLFASQNGKIVYLINSLPNNLSNRTINSLEPIILNGNLNSLSDAIYQGDDKKVSK